MGDTLFEMDEIPLVPPVRVPARRRSEGDARFRGEYPPEWDKCLSCGGTGMRLPVRAGVLVAGTIEWSAKPLDVQGQREVVTLLHPESGRRWEREGKGQLRLREAIMREARPFLRGQHPCPDCLGMGSVKAMVRKQAGFRCLRCKHPYLPKGDAEMVGGEPSFRQGGWSACDEKCDHGGVMRDVSPDGETHFLVLDRNEQGAPEWIREAQWRILTCHHLNGDKSDCRWGNVVALCQRCHLEIQAKVVIERVYPHRHTEWFKPYAAWWYALSYLGEDLSRDEVVARLDELLALELDPGIAHHG